MGNDVKYAEEQARINLKVVSDRVFLLFTGEVGQPDAKNKSIIPIPKDEGGSKPGTEKCDPDRVLRLSFLGEKFDFKVGEEKLVPRMAAKNWMLENLRHWENKVVLVMRETETQEQMRARLLKELKAEAATEAEPSEEEESADEPTKRKPGRPKKS